MMTEERSDVHRKSEIRPEEYEFVAVEHVEGNDLGACIFMMEQRRIIREHMARTGGKYFAGGNGVCHVCGSVNAIYTALWHHAKTNEYVRTGQECSYKMEAGEDCANAFRALRSSVEDARARKAGKAKAQVLLSDRGLSRLWDIARAVEEAKFEDEKNQNDEALKKIRKEERIVSDIVGKLVQYGSLSEPQFKFLGKLLYQIENRAKIEAERAAERADAKPCPTGRVTVKGVVLSIKDYPSDFSRDGVQVKMTVKSDEGWLCFGSVPSAFQVWKPTAEAKETFLERGDRVEFAGTLTPSDRDPKFGFFKRPSPISMEKGGGK